MQFYLRLTCQNKTLNHVCSVDLFSVMVPFLDGLVLGTFVGNKTLLVFELSLAV